MSVVHIHTGLPETHLMSRAANMGVHARQLQNAVALLKEASDRLNDFAQMIKRVREENA